MDRSTTAVLDACVLHPAPLRDLLVELAVSGMFQAHWTEEIHQEWIGSLRARRPDLSPAKLARTRRLMDIEAPNSLATGHLALVPSLTLPDPGDRHVLAAAIHCQARAIVTTNLKHFPPSLLDEHHIQAIHPDDFLLILFDGQEAGVCAALRTIRLRLRNPPVTVEEHLLTLEQQGLAQLVARLREFADLL